MSPLHARRLSSFNATAFPRRASLALPFVITAAAASCTPRPAQEPTAVPLQGEQEATPVIISNPPQPRPAAEQAGTSQDPTVSTPESGVVAPSEAKPVIMRNPPPPAAGEVSDAAKIAPVDAATAVKRPAELPKAPASGGVVSVRDDGTCWWQASVTCPPKTMCNPPPPNQVQCAATKPSRSTRNK